jgi:hypothetical protein
MARSKIGYPDETLDGQLSILKDLMTRCDIGQPATKLDGQVKDWIVR